MVQNSEKFLEKFEGGGKDVSMVQRQKVRLWMMRSKTMIGKQM